MTGFCKGGALKAACEVSGSRLPPQPQSTVVLVQVGGVCKGGALKTACEVGSGSRLPVLDVHRVRIFSLNPEHSGACAGGWSSGRRCCCSPKARPFWCQGALTTTTSPGSAPRSSSSSMCAPGSMASSQLLHSWSTACAELGPHTWCWMWWLRLQAPRQPQHCLLSRSPGHPHRSSCLVASSHHSPRGPDRSGISSQ